MNYTNIIQGLSDPTFTYNTTIKFFEQERKKEQERRDKVQNEYQKALKESVEHRRDPERRLCDLCKDCGQKPPCAIM
jgi:hypothetical protein